MIQMSDETGNLWAALAAAQAEFEAIAKTETNPFYKSSYAGLPSVVKAASPITSKHGLAVMQLPGYDGNEDTLTTVVGHSSGQWIASTMLIRPVKDNDPQAQGSAITYGRRYSYMGALNLVADDDDDGNAASKAATSRAPRPTQAPPPRNESRPPPGRPSKEDIERMRAEATRG